MKGPGCDASHWRPHGRCLTIQTSNKKSSEPMKVASKSRREMADRIERRPNAEKAKNRTADQSTHQSDPDDYNGHLDVHSSLDVALHEVPTANDRWVSNFDQFFVRLPITVKCSPHRFR